MKWGFKRFVFAVVILMLLILFVIDSTFLSCWDFRNNLWAPTSLLTHHQSPYRIDQLFDLGNAVWMPMAIGIFFPLGFLSLQQASNLWFVFNLIWFLLIIWISSGSRRPSISLFGIAILLSFLFPPSITHLWLGQISILITLISLTIVIWYDEIPVILLTFLIAISLSKPQLAILTLPGFIVYRVKKYGFQKAVQLVLCLIGCILVLTIPLFLTYRNWIPDFILALKQNPSWAHPSSLNILRTTLPNIGTVLWIILATVIFALNIWLWIILPSQEAIFWSLALTCLITPYVWTGDFVTILPLFISSLFKAKTKISLAILLGGYIVCWGLITNMKIREVGNDSFYWWVPWLLVAIIMGSKHLKIQRNLRRNPILLGAERQKTQSLIYQDRDER